MSQTPKLFIVLPKKTKFSNWCTNIHHLKDGKRNHHISSWLITRYPEMLCILVKWINDRLEDRLTEYRLSSSFMSPEVSNWHIKPSTEAERSLFWVPGIKRTCEQSKAQKQPNSKEKD